MRVLIACEFSGIVRTEFELAGHYAVSCDLQPSELPGNHIQGDVLTLLDQGWDLMIAHPPCTNLSFAGNRFLKQPGRREAIKRDFEFFMRFINAPVPFIAVENPRGWVHSMYRRPDQVIQPWQFGHNVTKATGLWLKCLPPLMYSYICPEPFRDWSTLGHHPRINGSKANSRSRTFKGIAQAMACQWSAYIKQTSATA